MTKILFLKKKLQFLTILVPKKLPFLKWHFREKNVVTFLKFHPAGWKLQEMNGQASWGHWWSFRSIRKIFHKKFYQNICPLPKSDPVEKLYQSFASILVFTFLTIVFHLTLAGLEKCYLFLHWKGMHWRFAKKLKFLILFTIQILDLNVHKTRKRFHNIYFSTLDYAVW